MRRGGVVDKFVLCAICIVADTANARAELASEFASSPAETSSDVPSSTEAIDSLSAEQLRALEAFLSQNIPLGDDDIAALVLTANQATDPRLRAHAVAILPWLPPSSSYSPLMNATVDEDERVRSFALHGLLAVQRRIPVPGRAPIVDAAVRSLDDKSDSVSCAAARLLVALDNAKAAESIRARAVVDDGRPSPTLSNVRYQCFAALVSLPPNVVSLDVLPVSPREMVPTTETTTSDANGVTRAPADDTPPDEDLAGTVAFHVVAASVGGITGALVPGIFVPAQDTLTYTPGRTRRTRVEPNIVVAGGLSALGTVLFGAGALTTTFILDKLELRAPTLSASTSIAAVAAGGVAGGAGLGLVLGLDRSLTGASSVIGGVSGFFAGTVMSLVLTPSAKDVSFMAAASTMGILCGGLITFAALPVGVPLVFDRVFRTDFAVGAAFISGTTLGLLAYLASPIIDVSHGRTLAATGTALAFAGLTVATTYLLMPVGITIRQRVASGIGATAAAVSGLLVFTFLPDSWARAIDRDDVPVGKEALVLQDGRWKLGIPSVAALANDVSAQTMKTGPTMTMNLIGGTF